MHVVIVRHGPAGDRERFARTGRPDTERPLTDDGRERMVAAARGLHHVLGTLDAILTSPLVRARETAAIVGETFDGTVPVEEPALAPESEPAALLAALGEFDGDATIAVVGHDPHLSYLAGFLVSGEEAAPVELKKGAACLVTFDGVPSAGAGTIAWLLPPKVLRRLAEHDA